MQIAAAALLGMVIGSFLNVLIHRLPRMLEARWRQDAIELLEDGGALSGAPPANEAPYGLARPRSHCPACGAPIRPWHNVPLLSWLWLRGRCADCSAAIPVRYPLVEALGALVAAAAVWRFGPTAAGAGAVLLSFVLIALTFIDLDTQLLPDDLTLPLLWSGLLFNLGGTFATLESAVIGAVAGYGALWLVYHGFRLATGKEGMGYGDFKLLAALGAWFGWQVLPAILLLASASGAAVGIALIVFARHGRDVPIPFGPYLAAAGMLALYTGRSLALLIGVDG